MGSVLNHTSPAPVCTGFPEIDNLDPFLYLEPAMKSTVMLTKIPNPALLAPLHIPPNIVLP